MSDITTFMKQNAKWVSIGASVLVFALIALLARTTISRDMSLLYSGLGDSAAGEIIAALDAEGTSYEVRSGNIYVDTSRRDTVRMILAGQGLPSADVQGYELLDNLSGFSTTAQMFDATYWRAKEGELARTIVSSPNIKAARVHIAPAAARAFGPTKSASAAVTITTNGIMPSPAQVQALQFLVASAVPELDSKDVSIIDSRDGLLNGNENTLHRTNDVAANLRDRVMRLLEAHVGTGNAVVEVDVEAVTETESLIERTINPQSRIAISSDIAETVSNSKDNRADLAVTTSNLPDGDAASGRDSSSEKTETRTLTNYDVSEVQREIHRAPGTIKRISVAVLLNTPEGEAERKSNEIKSLQELIASAVGFDETRGDSITVHSLPFEPATSLGTAAEFQAPSSTNMTGIIQFTVLALVIVIIALFVVRPALMQQKTVLNNDMPDFERAPVMQASLPLPKERLGTLLTERKQDSMRVLQSWLDETEQKT